MTRGPLTGLAAGTDGPNGVYKYGASAFPTLTFRNTNYLVDVVFDTTSTDTIAPTVVEGRRRTMRSVSSSRRRFTARFSEPVTPGRRRWFLTGPGGASGRVRGVRLGHADDHVHSHRRVANSTTYRVSDGRWTLPAT